MSRWFGIRHLRWAWYHWRVHAFARKWGAIGIGLDYPNESDLRMLDAIWRGEA